MQGHDPRFGQRPYAPPPQAHAPQSQSVYGQQPGGYVPQQQAYGAQQQQQHAQHAQQPYQPPPHVPMYGGSQHMASMGALGGALGGMAGKQPSGLPAMLSFPLGMVAVLVALVFDVIFLKIHIPGVGSYAWYLTTALSFAGAGWASIKWTKASKTVAMTAVGVAAAIYGVADLGLGLVLEDLSLGGAIVLGAQGVGIGLFTGFGGVFKALRERE